MTAFKFSKFHTWIVTQTRRLSKWQFFIQLPRMTIRRQKLIKGIYLHNKWHFILLWSILSRTFIICNTIKQHSVYWSLDSCIRHLLVFLRYQSKISLEIVNQLSQPPLWSQYNQSAKPSITPSFIVKCICSAVQTQRHLLQK